MNGINWMNRRKSISGIFITVLMVLMIPLQSAGSELPFTDVPSSQWYFNDVLQAYGSELVDGFEDQTFRPDENMTYAQAVKLAACMNQKYTTGSVTLTNGSSQWYDSYVSYAKNNGIITKDYPWNASATRAGYVEIFAAALPDDALETKNAIADGAVPDVVMSHPQATAIYRLYRAGILNGVDEKGTFLPDSNIKRSEVSAILTRMMNQGSRKKVKLGTAQGVSQLFLWSDRTHLTYGGNTTLTLHLCVPEGEDLSNVLLMDNQSDILLSIHKNELQKSEKQRSVGSEYFDDYYCTWSYDDAGDSDTRTAFSIRAEMDDTTSNELRLYRDVPVTDEMVNRLCTIEDELGAFAEKFTKKKENQTPEKVMSAVRGWLEDRPDVYGITEGTENLLLFYTADGLCGAYELIDHEMNTASKVDSSIDPQLKKSALSTESITTDSGQVASSFNEAETVSTDGLLQTDSREGVTTDPDKMMDVFDKDNYSKKTPINTNSMVLLPLTLKGTLIGFDGNSEFSAIESLDSAIGGTHFSVRDNTNLRIRDGSMAKYGTVTLTTHGSYEKNDGNPFVLFMTYANHSRDTAKSFWDSYLSQFSVEDQLNEQNSLMRIDEKGYSVWKEKPAETKLCICRMQDVTTFAAPVYVIMTSTNYIMDIYQSAVFPNTLMYFNACYGGAVDCFNDFLQSRGATILGPNKPADVASSVLLEFFFKSYMLKKGTPEMISGFWRNYNVREARYYTNSTVGWYHDSEFCYLGRGRITGTIRDQAGNGISGATVKAFRYLNKKLILQETVESKEDGTYSLDLDNGTYLLQAYKNNIETFLQVSNFDPAAVSLLQDQDMTLDIACPVISACIGEYRGKVYKIGKSVAELEALPVKPAKYSYICSFAFYNGKVYYCCKDGGTSDYRMALYEANLDGTGQRELFAPEKTDMNLNLFAIEKGSLYYLEVKWSGRTKTEIYHKINLKDGTITISDKTPETVRKALSSGSMYLTCQGCWFAEAKSETNRFINDRIVMEKTDGTTQNVAKTAKSISLDGVVPADSEGDYYIYYSTINDGENAVLYRVRLGTGETKKIDSHMAAGGGIYFNW